MQPAVDLPVQPCDCPRCGTVHQTFTDSRQTGAIWRAAADFRVIRPAGACPTARRNRISARRCGERVQTRVSDIAPGARSAKWSRGRAPPPPPLRTRVCGASREARPAPSCVGSRRAHSVGARADALVRSTGATVRAGPHSFAWWRQRAASVARREISRTTRSARPVGLQEDGPRWRAARAPSRHAGPMFLSVLGVEMSLRSTRWEADSPECAATHFSVGSVH